MPWESVAVSVWVSESLAVQPAAGAEAGAVASRAAATLATSAVASSQRPPASDIGAEGYTADPPSTGLTARGRGR